MKFILKKLEYESEIKLIYSLLKDNGNLRHQVYNSFEIFEKIFFDKLHYYYHDFFIVTDTSDKIIGYIYMYDYRDNDRHCTMKYWFCDSGKNITKEIINFTITTIFKEYSLERIFVYSIDSSDTDTLTDIGFIKDATLNEYIFLNGKYHDVDVLRIEREEYHVDGTIPLL